MPDRTGYVHLQHTQEPNSGESCACSGATLKSGCKGDCLLHIPATSEMPTKSNPRARLLYTQRPASPAAASHTAHAAALAEGLLPEEGSAVSLEALASVMVSGGTILAADGDLALPWLGQLGSFFAIGTHHEPTNLIFTVAQEP